MRIQLIGVLLFIAGVLVWMYFSLALPSVYREPLPSPSVPHLYYDSSRSLGEIEIAAFYFVPKNKVASQLIGWQNILEENLKKLQTFHELQFRGRSHITYTIYPEPVIGRKDNLVYDTDRTDRGNPQALIRVAEEIDLRVFRKEGDLYRSDFLFKSRGAYPVTLILYEGVGASGGVIQEDASESVSEIAQKLGLPESVVYPVKISAFDGFLLIGRTFVSDQRYREIAASLMAHEFYHTLGIPDAYEVAGRGAIEIVSSSDLMGSGRKKPLEKTYLRKESLIGFAP